MCDNKYDEHADDQEFELDLDSVFNTKGHSFKPESGIIKTLSKDSLNELQLADKTKQEDYEELLAI